MRWKTPLLAVLVPLTMCGEPLPLILAPQQTSLSATGTAKFDLYLVNDTKAAVTVPSLESFRAVYTVRRHGSEETTVSTYARIFSHPLKPHPLKAGRVDHATVEMEFKPEGGDFIEVHVEVGDNPSFKSNSVLLLCRSQAE